MEASGSALALFRIGDFRTYQFSRLVLITAGQMLMVAVGWQVYEITRSPLHLGYVGLAAFVPNVAFSLIAGHVADRVDRRFIVMACAGVSAATAGLLAWQASQPMPSLLLIYVASALLGVNRAFSAPAGHALLPALVPKELISRAVIWHLIIFQLATVVGPAIGGFIYAGSHAARVYSITVALYLVAMAGMTLMKSRPRLEASAEPMVRAVSAGIRYVWRDKRLLGAMSLDLFAVLLGGATALFPVFANLLQAGPEGLGILRSAPSFGAGAAALLLAFRPIQRRIGAWLLCSVALFGLATIVFGLSRTFALSVGAMAVAGAADMVSVTVRHTLIQVATPDAMRGRVSAVSMIFISSSNELGEFESGLTAHWWGPVRAVVYGGIGTCAIVLAWAGLFPRLRRVDRFEDAPSKDAVTEEVAEEPRPPSPPGITA